MKGLDCKMCKKCNEKPVYIFTNKRQVCKTCFIRWFEKKVLYTIKKFSMVKKGDVIGYNPGKDFRDVVLEDALKYYESKAPVSVVKGAGKEFTKTAIPITTDVIANDVVSNIINSTLTRKNLPVRGKVIKPLYLFLDKEVLLYAKLKGLKFVKSKEGKDKMQNFLNDMEKKHPEVKRAIVNAYLKLA